MAKGIFDRILRTVAEAIAGSEEPSNATRRPSKTKTATSARPAKAGRVTSPHPIADAILAFEPVSLKRTARATHAQYAAKVGLTSPFIKSEADHANAFLFGVISDRMIDANKAWRVPYELSKRLKHLDVAKIARMAEADLTAILAKPTNLHRFNAATAKGFIAASKHLVAKHEGSALDMWRDGTSAPQLLEELESLPGISHKLSAMTLQLLITQMGVDIRDVAAVNVAVDRHVARVFLRTGLVDGFAGRTVYRAAELKPSVIQAAREASPTFPGALDLPAFWIGKQWCTHADARCVDCPIRDVCPKQRRKWSVGVVKNGKRLAE